ncbi:MAG: hypothetical protein ACLP59_31875 [Bryobacteraceae bacterium]
MKTNVLIRLVFCSTVAMASAASLGAAEFYYAETTATLSYTTEVGPTPIPGLTFIVPAAGKDFNTAVITLSMPNLFLSEQTSKTIPMAATFQIVAPFATSGPVPGIGYIGCDSAAVSTSGPKPLTIVAKIPLGTTPQPVEAEWFSNGTSTVTTQYFASLSAILVKE